MKRFYEEMLESAGHLARTARRAGATDEAIEQLGVILPDEIIRQLEIERERHAPFARTEPLKFHGLRVIAASDHR